MDKKYFIIYNKSKMLCTVVINITIIIIVYMIYDALITVVQTEPFRQPTIDNATINKIIYAQDTTQKAAREYSMYLNIDYTGGDISSYEKKSVGECKNICDNTEHCDAFVYDTQAAKCYLKDSEKVNAVPVYRKDFNYYYINPPTAGPALNLATLPKFVI